MRIFRQKKGFSLVELIVAIAILAVLLAVLTPFLINYVELSRARRDNKAMDEVRNAVMLSLSEQDAYDEMLTCVAMGNASCYIDRKQEPTSDRIIIKDTWYSAKQTADVKTGDVTISTKGGLAKRQYMYGDKYRQLDGVRYYLAGNMRGATITFSPQTIKGSHLMVMKDGKMNALFNDESLSSTMWDRDDRKFYLDTGHGEYISTVTADDNVDNPDHIVFNKIKTAVGDEIKLLSRTYRYSDYTVFITLGSLGGNQGAVQDKLSVYGQWNGTNLPSRYDPNNTVVDPDDPHPEPWLIEEPIQSFYYRLEPVFDADGNPEMIEWTTSQGDATETHVAQKYELHLRVSPKEDDVANTIPESKKYTEFVLKSGSTALTKDDWMQKPGWPWISQVDSSYNDTSVSPLQISKTVVEEDIAPRTGAQFFQNLKNMTVIENQQHIRFDNMCTINYMFDGCESLNNLNSANWHLQKSNGANAAFRNCKTITTLKTSNWDLRNITTTEQMFQGCENLVTLDVSLWNLGQNTSTMSMFKDCSSLNGLDVSKWDMSNVVDSSHMFRNCVSLKNLNVSKWNVHHVQKMNYMFANCKKLESLDVSNWDVSKVGTRGAAFAPGGGGSFNYMFINCESIPKLDVSKWDVSNSPGIRYMFSRLGNKCSVVAIVGLQNWKPTSVTDAEGAFDGCFDENKHLVGGEDADDDISEKDSQYGRVSEESLRGVETWGSYMTNVSKISNMFRAQKNLTVFDMSNWNLPNAENSSRMFCDCKALTTVNVTGLNANKLSNLSGMFLRCKNLTSVNGIEGLNAGSFKEISFMFAGCHKINGSSRKINLGSWAVDLTSGNAKKMFSSCSNLKEIHIEKFKVDDMSKVSEMLNGATNGTKLYVGEDWVKNEDGTYAAYDGLGVTTYLVRADGTQVNISNP